MASQHAEKSQFVVIRSEVRDLLFANAKLLHRLCPSQPAKFLHRLLNGFQFLDVRVHGVLLEIHFLR